MSLRSEKIVFIPKDSNCPRITWSQSTLFKEAESYSIWQIQEPTLQVLKLCMLVPRELNWDTVPHGIKQRQGWLGGPTKGCRSDKNRRETVVLPTVCKHLHQFETPCMVECVCVCVCVCDKLHTFPDHRMGSSILNKSFSLLSLKLICLSSIYLSIYHLSIPGKDELYMKIKILMPTVY